MVQGWNPSYDFRLFDIGFVSPLQAQEFGAQTMFRASDPTSFVDYSLNQLAAILQPGNPRPFPQRQLPMPMEEIPFVSFFQAGAEDTRERLRRVRDEADRMLREAGGGDVQRFPSGGASTQKPQCGTTKCIWWERWLGKKDGECCHDVLISDDSGVGTTTPTGERAGDATKQWLAALPPGAGVFLIAVAALIFILLFARK